MVRHVAVIGAGIGGLAASIALATEGVQVTLLERAETPGGKMRQVRVGEARIDAGPTVLTMQRVFEELFEAAGETLSDHVTLEPVTILARHAWSDNERFDLHANRALSADAIARFAGPAEARGYLDFSDRAARIWQTLEPSFIRAQRPTVAGLTARAGPRQLAGISPFTTMARALAQHFNDPRLRQLFGRYATYCGSSPYASPATLMLVAHLESQGVWRVQGGMHALAAALAALAARLGVTVRTNARVETIETIRGRAAGVTLAGGERIEADAVICNADANAVATGRFGALGGAVPPTQPGARSLSALTWAVHTRPSGFPLLHHNVFFGTDSRREFEQLADGRLPESPTIYICAQDRADAPRDAGDERLLVLVNAPATGDRHPPDELEIARCRDRTIQRLHQCGLSLDLPPERTVKTGPIDWERLFPATGGALYGANAHGWMATFRRPGARTRLPGLYLAGGSTHPGPGVPMAALSGRLAASALMEDLASTRPSHRTAISGGTSTPSAKTAATA
jgi:1-hydroxycarotenoid 3,4-desaturase